MAGITHYGWAESTAAMRSILSKGLNGARGVVRRRRKSKAAKTVRKARRKAAKKGRAHLVKGSAAAKRYMAKLRAKAKRKR